MDEKLRSPVGAQRRNQKAPPPPPPNPPPEKPPPLLNPPPLQPEPLDDERGCEMNVVAAALLMVCSEFVKKIGFQPGPQPGPTYQEGGA
jgi:hypothetical protein